MARGAAGRVDIRQFFWIIVTKNLCHDQAQHYKTPRHVNINVFLFLKNIVIIFRDPRNLDALAPGIDKTVLEVL